MNKQQLLSELGLTPRTLKRSLEACGIDPTQEEFSDEEVQRVREARQMVDRGASYSDVSNHFGIEFDEADEVEEEVRSTETRVKAGDRIAQIHEQIRSQVKRETESATKEVIDDLPLIMLEVWHEVLESGYLRQQLEAASTSNFDSELEGFTMRRIEQETEEETRNLGLGPGADIETQATRMED